MSLDASPAVGEMLDNVNAASVFLKRLAHPTRLMVVCALVDGERSVRELEDGLGLRQPALSQQLAELRENGFISSRKDSRSVYYRLADERIAGFVGVLHDMFCEGGRD